MGYVPYSSGFQRLTASGVVSDSGKPILITGYTVEAGAGGVSTPYFRNGTAAGSATAFAAQTTTASTANAIGWNLPVMLPLGCFVSFDSNTTAVTVNYILQATS